MDLIKNYLLTPRERVLQMRGKNNRIAIQTAYLY